MRAACRVLTVAAIVSAGAAPAAARPAGALESHNVVVQSVGTFDERYPPPPHARVRIEKAVRVPMRDGVRLSTDLYFPADAAPPFPVIAIRLPYDKNTFRNYRQPGSDAHFFAGHGYAVAIQDMRGRFESEGTYTYFSGDREGQDGYDFVEWLSKRRWSNGKVGTYGCSYLGENQVVLAAERHPRHVAAIPQGCGSAYNGTFRPIMGMDGGVPELATIVSWMIGQGDQLFARPPASLSDRDFNLLAERFQTRLKHPDVDLREAFKVLPVVDVFKRIGHGIPTDYEKYVAHVPLDKAYHQLSAVSDRDRFDVPALHVNSWYDGGADETMRSFNLLRTNAVSPRGRDHQYVIMSPTNHCDSDRVKAPVIVGQRNMGDATLPYFRIYLDWFDHWVKGVPNDVPKRPRVQYYLMGANEWRGAQQWPLPETRYVKYFLRGGGKANTRNGDGALSPEAPATAEAADRFRYDPMNPVPSVGGPICCTTAEAAPSGAFDQSNVELRDDILVYTSAPLKQGLTVVGPMSAVLYVSSSAPDTDFTVKLVDVLPEGRAFNVQESILRARYRDGFAKPRLIKPGEVYKLDINLHATANRFLPGHRVRVEVSSSNFPRFARNLNTGGPSHLETEPVIAENTLHHSAAHPSHLVLPVIE